MKNTDFLTFEEIQVGSIWLAADGSDYGYCVIGKDEDTKDILVKPFDSRGWCYGPDDIDWFKLQYRCKPV